MGAQSFLGKATATCLALPYITISIAVAQIQLAQSQHTVDPELQSVVEQFVKAVDQGDVAAVAAAYSPDFLNVRVADDGGFARLSRAQILAILKASPAKGKSAGPSIPTKDTVIQHAEVIGDRGFVLMSRVKDLGNGWEPLFYSLVWQKKGGKWELLREYVHQRSVPKHL
jgi:ketosteroid isomerase-like protein